MRRLGDAVSAFRSGKGLKGQLLRGGVGSLAVKLGSTLLNVLLAVVLARTLGAEGFGIYSFVFALITILAIPAQMGLPNLVVRETAKAQANGDWALIKGLWRWSTLMALAMSLALMAIGALAAWLFASRLPDGGLAVFYWGLVLVPLVALGNLRGAALRGLRHVVKGQLPEFILRPAFLILLVLGAHFGLSAQALTASDAMMLHALASLGAFGIGAWLLLRARPIQFKHQLGRTAHSTLWLASAVPLGLLEGMQLLGNSLDIIILGIFVSAPETGVYKVAAQLSPLVTLPITALNLAISPHISKLLTEDNRKDTQTILKYVSMFSASIGLVSMIVMILFGHQAIEILFGEEYHNAYIPMIILVSGQMLIALMGAVVTVTMMAGYEKLAATYMIIGVFGTLIFQIILIPLFGAIGAAIGTVLGFSGWRIALHFKVKQVTGIDASAMSILPRIPIKKKANT